MSLALVQRESLWSARTRHTPRSSSSRARIADISPTSPSRSPAVKGPCLSLPCGSRPTHAARERRQAAVLRDEGNLLGAHHRSALDGEGLQALGRPRHHRDRWADVLARRGGGLEPRGPAKRRHPYCSPKLGRNKVGSLATERDESFEFVPAHTEPLHERRVRFERPSPNGFEHLVHPIWDIHPLGHQPDYAGSRATGVNSS